MYTASSSTSARSPIKYERDNLVIRSVQDDFKTLLLNQSPQLSHLLKRNIVMRRGDFDKRDAINRYRLCYQAAHDEAQAP